MLQVLEYQRNLVDLAILGSSHVPDNIKTIRFKEFILLCKTPLSEGKDRVFHARRNDEMLQALIAKKIFGAKIKIAFTSTGQRYHSKFTRYLMSQMDGIISTNQKAAAYLIDKPADIIVPHGVDTSTFYPSKDRKKAWQSLNLPGEFGIGVFGRVRKSKGIDILVEASLPLLEKYTEATIVICGQCLEKDAPFQEQLKEKIAQAGLSKRYVFLGEQPFKRIPELFRAMTIVTALSREEGYGLTPLEAMASGCAVLTSEAGAWKDIIRNDREGYCIATKKWAALGGNMF